MTARRARSRHGEGPFHFLAGSRDSTDDFSCSAHAPIQPFFGAQSALSLLFKVVSNAIFSNVAFYITFFIRFETLSRFLRRDKLESLKFVPQFCADIAKYNKRIYALALIPSF